MIRICKVCKQEIDIAEDSTANLRCNNCGSVECSFEETTILKCHYCKKEKKVLAGEFINIVNSCNPAIGQTQRALWVIKGIEEEKGEKSILDQIAEGKEKLKEKITTKKRGRPKKKLFNE